MSRTERTVKVEEVVGPRSVGLEVSRLDELAAGGKAVDAECQATSGARRVLFQPRLQARAANTTSC